MRNHLDLTLSRTNKASNSAPRMTLRRNTSFTDAPLSATSSRFSFNHLLSSPPPSPFLPALVPRHGKATPSPTPRKLRKLFRLLIWISLLFTIIYLAIQHTPLQHYISSTSNQSHTSVDDEPDLVGSDELPDIPTPVVVTDKSDKARWTVSIPPGYRFPLSASEYLDICDGVDDISSHVSELNGHKHTKHSSYYQADSYFMDPVDAGRAGLLLSANQIAGYEWKSRNTPASRRLVGEEKIPPNTPICESSLTVILETEDAGLGQTLMMLWTAYGLAKKEGRAFFIDDSGWAYGKYTDYFALPPLPNCRPTHRHEMLPCPHQARHLVVSDAVKDLTFGAQFKAEFGDGHKTGEGRQHAIFKLARTGYESLFQLNDENSEYLKLRLNQLATKAGGPRVGIHVRRGDKHPKETQFERDSYIPLDRYVTAANELLISFGDESVESSRAAATALLVASDDPDVFEEDEFAAATRAQTLIRLASQQTMYVAPTAASEEKVGMFNKFKPSPVGWEGGFFAPMFWSLGRPDTTGIDVVDSGLKTSPPTEETLRLRGLVGRAYLLDLAVLGRASDAIVCTVSAMGCRLLAVILGWESAIDRNMWRNIDGHFEWYGLEV